MVNMTEQRECRLQGCLWASEFADAAYIEESDLGVLVDEGALKMGGRHGGLLLLRL